MNYYYAARTQNNIMKYNIKQLMDKRNKNQIVAQGNGGKKNIVHTDILSPCLVTSYLKWDTSKVSKIN